MNEPVNINIKNTIDNPKVNLETSLEKKQSNNVEATCMLGNAEIDEKLKDVKLSSSLSLIVNAKLPVEMAPSCILVIYGKYE